MPSPERSKRWTWTMAPPKGTLDEENEKVILDTRKALLAMKFSEEKIIKELNKLFGNDKVESALNGAYVSCPSLISHAALCENLEALLADAATSFQSFLCSPVDTLMCLRTKRRDPEHHILRFSLSCSVFDFNHQPLLF